MLQDPTIKSYEGPKSHKLSEGIWKGGRKTCHLSKKYIYTWICLVNIVMHERSDKHFIERLGRDFICIHNVIKFHVPSPILHCNMFHGDFAKALRLKPSFLRITTCVFLTLSQNFSSLEKLQLVLNNVVIFSWNYQSIKPPCLQVMIGRASKPIYSCFSFATKYT